MRQGFLCWSLSGEGRHVPQSSTVLVKANPDARNQATLPCTACCCYLELHWYRRGWAPVFPMRRHAPQLRVPLVIRVSCFLTTSVGLHDGMQRHIALPLPTSLSMACFGQGRPLKVLTARF